MMWLIIVRRGDLHRLVGRVYERGLSGSRANPFGDSACLLGLLLAGRLWRGQYVTLADFYRERYHGWFVEKLAILHLACIAKNWRRCPGLLHPLRSLPATARRNGRYALNIHIIRQVAVTWGM